VVFLAAGITIGRKVGSGEDHFLPPLPRDHGGTSE
jgi:hypothetical protein